MKRIAQSLVIALCIGATLGSKIPLHAAGIQAHFFPFTGEVRLYNPNVTPFDFVFYSIRSELGSLDASAGAWKSISDNYDASGNGFIDSDNEWMKLSSSSTELAEGILQGDGGQLPALRAVSLGNIWSALAPPVPDIEIQIATPDNQVLDVGIVWSINGDYNRDLTVDHADFSFWKNWFGSTFFLWADGNLDGVVDAADYTIWRDNLGMNFSGLSFALEETYGLSAVQSMPVPEPSSLVLISLIVGMSLMARRHFRVH